MPTPFYHLDLAERLLDAPMLAPEFGDLLRRARPAFLFGNTAPDYVTLAGLPRSQGHFFDVPIHRDQPAHQRLLDLYPRLKRASRLSEDQSAFVAGYLAHLWLDQAWIIGVFEPIFGPDVHRGSFKNRLLDHNLLRAALDRQAYRRLPIGLGDVLSAAQPREWLPFAEDYLLAAWRDHLAEQLSPGGSSRTIAVFAQRHGISPSDFTQQLDSQQAMSRAVFQHLSPDSLARLQDLWLSWSVELVNDYLSEGHRPASHVNQPLRMQLTRHTLQGGD